MVTITYGTVYQEDCDSVANWSEINDDFTITLANIVYLGDVFKIEGTCAGAGDEYYQIRDTTPSFNTNTYTGWMARYKTSAASDGLGARICANFSAGTQWLVGETEPQFSTTWTVASGTLTAGKTLEQVDLYADDYPNSTASGTSSVSYDFIMFYKAAFTLPNVKRMELDLPTRSALLAVPGRDTDITQHLGTESAAVTFSWDLDQSTWKRTGDNVDGEVFLDITHNQGGWPWQWLDTGSHQFKVTVHPTFRWIDSGRGATSRMLDVAMKEYSLSDKSNETYAERFGIGL